MFSGIYFTQQIKKAAAKDAEGRCKKHFFSGRYCIACYRQAYNKIVFIYFQ